MHQIVKVALVATAIAGLTACTSQAPLNELPDATVFPDATAAPAQFTLADYDENSSVEDHRGAVGEAQWTSPTSFVFLSQGSSSCYFQPSSIIAPDSLTIEVEYAFVGGPGCTQDLRLYRHEIEIPPGVTSNSTVELSVTFPAINDVIAERTVTTTIGQR